MWVVSVGGECECRQQPARRYKTCGRSLKLLSRSQPFAVRNNTRCTIPTHTHTCSHASRRASARPLWMSISVLWRYSLYSRRASFHERRCASWAETSTAATFCRALSMCWRCACKMASRCSAVVSRERGEETEQECQS